MSVRERRAQSMWLWLTLLQLVITRLPDTVAASESSTVNYSRHRVIRVRPATSEQMTVVRRAENDLNYGIDVWKEARTANSSIDLQVRPEVYSRLTSRLRHARIPYEITIDDLQSVIDQQREESRSHRAAARRRRATVVNVADESNDIETDDVVGTYASHDEINNWMTELERSHPDLIQLIDIGRSYEGRRLVVLKIGKRPSANKPAIWIDAGIHAREWIAPATAVFIIHSLVTGYKHESVVTELLTEFDWYIQPVLNPDGYEYSNTTDRMWRKTRSRIANNNRRNCVGVDANRNFDFNWLSECDESTVRCRGRHPCENVFAGRHPLSEPETIAVANFILRRRSSIKLYLSLHSYSQLWLTPWGYTTQPPADNDDLIRVANKAVEALESYYNTQYEVGSPAVILYAATGGSYDWAKGVAGIKYSYTIELRDTGDYGFLLPQSQIRPTGEETWAGVRAAVQEIRRDTCWMYGRHCN